MTNLDSTLKSRDITLTINFHLVKDGGFSRPASWEICMQIKKQQLEPDMEQQTGSKLGKEYIKVIYCHRDYLAYM